MMMMSRAARARGMCVGAHQRDGVVFFERCQLHKVMSVGAGGALSCVSRLSVAAATAVVVGVGAGPLNVDEVGGRGGEAVGQKVVLHCRIRLNDVAALAWEWVVHAVR